MPGIAMCLCLCSYMYSVPVLPCFSFLQTSLTVGTISRCSEHISAVCNCDPISVVGKDDIKIMYRTHLFC